MYEHEDAQTGQVGCGAEWLVKVTYDTRKRREGVKFGEVPEAELYRYWFPARDLADELPKTLTDVRASVGKWVTALAAIIVVVGLSAVIGGRSTIQDLSWPYKLAFAIALGAALLGQGLVLYFGDVASFGFPKLRSAFRGRALVDEDLEPIKEAATPIRDIRTAQVFTAISFLGALAALLLFSIPGNAGPPKHTQPKVKLTLVLATATPSPSASATPKTTQTTSCGTLAFNPPYPTATPAPSATPTPASTPSSVTFTPDWPSASPTVYPFNLVTSIDSC